MAISILSQNSGNYSEAVPRYKYDATWVLNPTHVLLRNTRFEYLLVTFAKPCSQTDRDDVPISFVPELQGRVYASLVYEARQHEKMQPACDITKLQYVKNLEEARSIAGGKTG